MLTLREPSRSSSELDRLGFSNDEEGRGRKGKGGEGRGREGKEGVNDLCIIMLCAFALHCT